VQVGEKNDKLKLPIFGSSILNFASWREQSQSFEALAGVGYSNYTLSGAGEPEQVSGNTISPVLVRVLGIPPLAGRAFTDEEEKPGAPAVAMIGEGLWKRRFGADPELIGRTLVLNGTPTTVVGIAPGGLKLISGGDIYTPLTINPAKEIRLSHTIQTYGRLKKNVSREKAQAEMDTVSASMGRQYPEIRDWGVHLVSMFDTFIGSELKTRILLLFWTVILVMLIACANIGAAAPQVLSQRLLDLSFAGTLGVRQESSCLHNHAVDAKAALYSLLRNERFLQSDQLPVRTVQAFEGYDLLLTHG